MNYRSRPVCGSQARRSPNQGMHTTQKGGRRVMPQIVILQREPDGGFVATVPALPGCVSQGDTREEAMGHVREAIQVYLEDCLAAGQVEASL